MKTRIRAMTTRRKMAPINTFFQEANFTAIEWGDTWIRIIREVLFGCGIKNDRLGG